MKQTMEEEKEFPSSDELVVAETLLLLGVMPPSPCLSSKSKRESSKSLALSSLNCNSVSNSKSNSKSCASISSAVTWDDDLASAEAQCRMMLQVVRKKRSLTFCISDGEKSRSAQPGKETSVTLASASSCLSNDSTSSTISSAGSQGIARMGKRERMKAVAEVLKPKKKPQGSTHIRRRAEAIINILSYGTASEVRIRQLLGDSPDTSKALRL
nr:uncharacterized protein LOC107845156 [Ipomoea batatas]GMD41762.1 uncharacterized protein LOC107845156 [Ipomoea batatas]GMD44696.1 uncharacterized protein LOC107845156 [Ipomoea batatas]GME08696.1 uncharacterized protein LOC107845156 [Ipomoea batatas]